MTASFGFFHDSALTQPINSGNPLTAAQDSDLSLSPTDKTIYFGSTASGKKVQSASGAGTTPISVSIVDSASGSGAPSTEFKLALSSGALSGATAGAALQIGTTINSGVGNAVPIYTRRTSAVATPGVYTDISLQTQTLAETAV